jgi:hypothetical protein
LNPPPPPPARTKYSTEVGVACDVVILLLAELAKLCPTELTALTVNV